MDAKAQFRSLAEPWADTGTSTGRLMIAVLGGLADVERDLIRTRTAEGRSRAQKRGQHMGRPSKLTDEQKAEARRRRAQGATACRTRAQLWRGQECDFATVTFAKYILPQGSTDGGAGRSRRAHKFLSCLPER